MTRLVGAIVGTVMGVTFVMGNMHSVSVNLIVGPPMEIRLVLLLLFAFLAGVLFAVFYNMISRARRRALERRTKQQELAQLQQEETLVR